MNCRTAGERHCLEKAPFRAIVTGLHGLEHRGSVLTLKKSAVGAGRVEDRRGG